eukprot:TRINITY_DN7654_c1_g1_i1.p1 TRINITY_DN7654_c1_g1~~TRINITY_DN7654_c1_g1_i1.p1  ORF type:complete len:119 (+),score=5.65 TRINITY_DN7654_c1_g1_i1:273-629(+)
MSGIAVNLAPLLSALATMVYYVAAMDCYRMRLDSHFPSFFKTHGMAFLYSSALQTTSVGNSSTLVCLKNTKKTQELAKLKLIHIIPLKDTSLGVSWRTPLWVLEVFFSQLSINEDYLF